MGGCGALRRCGCARTYEGTQFLCVKFRLGSAGEPTICSHCYSVPYMKIPANNQVFSHKKKQPYWTVFPSHHPCMGHANYTSTTPTDDQQSWYWQHELRMFSSSLRMNFNHLWHFSVSDYHTYIGLHYEIIIHSSVTQAVYIWNKVHGRKHFANDMYKWIIFLFMNNHIRSILVQLGIRIMHNLANKITLDIKNCSISDAFDT